jgi:hypothetical protein
MSCSAWACGLVPVAQTVAGNKNVLWDRQQSIGLHYGGSGCCFEKIDAPKGVEVTVFVDFNSKTCKFCRNGKVIAVKSVPEAEFPLRLGICGHSGTTFNIKPDKVSSAECLMAAQVGDSIFSSKVSAEHQALQILLPSGGAAGGKVMAVSDKSAKRLTFLRLEFSSGMEYDLWRRALLHTVPALTIGQSLSSFDSSPKLDAGKAAEKQVEPLNLLFSFLADTRTLCEERCASELFYYFHSYSLFEVVMFVWNEFGLRKVRFTSHHFHLWPSSFSTFVISLHVEHSEAGVGEVAQSSALGRSPPVARRGSKSGPKPVRAKRILSSKSVSGVHHPSVIWDGIIPQCGHPIHLKCALQQLEQLPKPGDRFLTRHASCGMCRAVFQHHALARTLAPFHSRMSALLAKLQEEKDALSADVAADVASLAPDAFLTRHVFMLCTGCKETCYAGLHQCMAADEVGSPIAEPQSPSSRGGDACDKGGWRCVACLNPNPEFPLCCSNPDHGENFIAFKCFYCCDVDILSQLLTIFHNTLTLSSR